MSSRPDSRRHSLTRGRRLQFRPEMVQLEDRATPATLTWNTPFGNGTDTVRVALEANNKIVIYDNGVSVQSANASKLTIQINGNSEQDILVVDYSGAGGFFTNRITFVAAGEPSAAGDTIKVTADKNFTLTDSQLTISGGGLVTISGVERAELTGGASGNVINASGFSGETTLTGGDGNDTITGGSGNDTIDGGSGSDVIDITAGGSDTVQTGGDDDTVIYKLVSDPGILAESTIITSSGGRDSLLAGPGQTVPVVITATDPTITIGTISLLGTLSTNSLTFTGDWATVGGGSGGDTFLEDVNLEHTFAMGTGPDTFVGNANGVAGTPGILAEATYSITDAGGRDRMNTTALGDSLIINLAENGDISTSTAGGVSIASVLVDISGTIEEAVGTAGDDVFFGSDANNVFDVGTGGSDTVFDSKGVDLISFESSTQPISCNLGVHVRQKVADGHFVTITGNVEGLIGGGKNDVLSGDNFINYLFGLGGDDVLQGQGGDDVLVGGDDNDDLNGGEGKDFMIGGRGADRIKGNSGEDLLIAGFTSYDQNLDALLALQGVWTGPGNYGNRVTKLTNTNETYFLNSREGDPDQTVFDDAAADTLTGAQQLDLFFLGVGDTITDNIQAGETVFDPLHPTP